MRVRAVRLLAALTAPPWRTRWAFVAALAAGAAYLDLFRLQLEWMGDDGVFTVGARRLARGEAAYRDFSTHTTPGAFYLIAAVGSILGHSFETARLVGMILALAVAGAVYVFTHRLTASVPVALLGFALALLPFAYAPSYSHHSLSA
ncbi:MAG TPA: hypothetical protein VEJ18_00570, partial [Planctomycetota bacterium]|nr:hypothetical protein [Planctomycetota bacterium]